MSLTARPSPHSRAERIAAAAAADGAPPSSSEESSSIPATPAARVESSSLAPSSSLVAQRSTTPSLAMPEVMPSASDTARSMHRGDTISRRQQARLSTEV